MNISPEVTHNVSVASAATAGSDWNHLERATATHEPSKERLSVYRFTQPILVWEGGSSTLRLLNPPLVRRDSKTVKLWIDDWGIELNIGDAGHLPRYLVRRFLALLQKSQENSLTESEAKNWLHIVDSVDMQRFAIQNSFPRYVEGKLEATRDGHRILWHDGGYSNVDSALFRSLEIINEGESFSAYAKFGEKDVLVSLERVMPLKAEELAS